MKPFLRRVLNILRGRPSKAPSHASLDLEIDFHIEELTHAYIASGMEPTEAARQALLAFGLREQMRQRLREVYLSSFVEAAGANARAAIRFLRHSPVFAFTVIATLALGIGANAAVFSAVNAVLLRPLAFPHGDELVEMRQIDFKSKNPNTLVAPLRLEDWNHLSDTFQAITGWFTENESDLSQPIPTRVDAAFVAPRFLEVWSTAPLIGRNFTPAEEHFGGPNAVLISYRYWHRQFDGDPHALGKTLRIGPTTYPVIGVMPQSFRFPDPDVDLWIPNAPDAPYSQDRASTWFTVVGRLKPGVATASAQADLAHVQRQLGKQFPKTDADFTVQLQPLKQIVLHGAGDSLWLLYGSVTLLLLIACTNIATLLLARTSERQHEISIRYALGASRGAIVLQLLAEVFLLALLGALLGLGLAGGATRLFHTFAQMLPRIDEVTLNWSIVAYALLCGLGATFACGLFPALRGTRLSLAGSMAQGSRTQVSTRIPLQWTLVGTQVALAVALLVGAGLLLRSLSALGDVDPGFSAAHVLTLHISGSYSETVDNGRLTARINRDLDGIRAVPGVEAAATSAMFPGIGGAYPAEFKLVDGRADPTQLIVADERYVSAGYLATLRMPLLQGSTCQANTPYPTLLVNRSFARTFLADTPVLGYHLRAASTGSLAGEILGVVGDAREEALTTTPAPTIYWCISDPDPDPVYLIRTHGDPMTLADSLRAAIHRIEPARSVYNLTPLAAVIGQQSADTRLRTALLTLIALTALALVSIGLWGTNAYLGRIREPEVGLRLALGAMPSQITRSLLVQSVRVAGLGCITGLLIGIALGKLLRGMLYDISVLDPLTYATVAVLVLIVSLGASLWPSVRAARVEPTRVLRNQ